MHKEVSTARLRASSSKNSVDMPGFTPNQTQQIELMHRKRFNPVKKNIYNTNAAQNNR